MRVAHVRQDGAMDVLQRYEAADDRYDAMAYRRCGRSGLQLPAFARAVAQLRRRHAARDASAPSCAARSTSASRTSTWPTTTARRTAAAEANFGADPRAGLPAVPRRAGHLHQGRLRHVAGPVRRPGLAQVPARQPRPVPDAGWAWTMSTSSTRHRVDPDTPLEETMGALDTAVRSGPGALRRHLLVLAGAHRAGGRILRDWARRC